MNTFDITSLATGTYTLKIQTTRGETVRRIVKK
ncbi:MAG: T9SS type A sorting domain-containing protein [Bacteroidales bacterium]|nr:T9SS type A sorting domain-containing protein [Bacteroidales bacterium]